MNKAVIVFLVALLVATAAAAPGRTRRKQLAGPPSEFSQMVIPTVDNVPSVRTSAEYTLQMSKAPGAASAVAEVEISVASGERVTLSVLSPDADKLTVSVASAQLTHSKLVSVEALAPFGVKMTKSSGPFAVDGSSVPSVSFVMEGAAAGVYRVVVERVPDSVADADATSAVVLLVGEESKYALYSHLTTYDLEVDTEIGITAQLIDTSVSGTHFARDAQGLVRRPAAYGSVVDARLIVKKPDGSSYEVPMKDDGASSDRLAADNVYGARIAVDENGSYLLSTLLSGKTPEGHIFERISHHIAPVQVPLATLTGISRLSLSNAADDVLAFELDVDSAEVDHTTLPTVRATAQVWGSPMSDDSHSFVPVAWMQSIEDVQLVDGRLFIQMDLNEQWLAKAGAKAPFVLREVVLQDVNSNALLSRRQDVYVQTTKHAEQRTRALFHNADVAITERMTMGPRPAQFAAPAAGEGKLLLVHGYCSGPVWPAEDFTNAAVFEDFSASRSQDEFAQRILAFGDEQGVPYSIVAHSQGGLAALHLKAFYWSGLDQVGEGRKIQSVGSPYQGCSMAGSLANVGNVFGVGCGSNYDLSPEGAQIWLQTIPAEARKEVFYYTTQYKPGFLANCVTASNLVLYTPNDGTCEKKFAVLDGANDMGHTEDWCHVSDMKFPPQCTDQSRNAEMGAAAAR